MLISNKIITNNVSSRKKELKTKLTLFSLVSKISVNLKKEKIIIYICSFLKVSLK